MFMNSASDSLLGIPLGIPFIICACTACPPVLFSNYIATKKNYFCVIHNPLPSKQTFELSVLDFIQYCKKG
jgi:hypothetical protein